MSGQASDVKVSFSADGRGLFSALDAMAGKVTGLNGLLKGLSGSLLAFFSAHQVLNKISEAVKGADHIGELAEKASVAVKTFSQLAYAADQTDVSTDSLRVGLKELGKWMKEVGRQGNDLTDELMAQSAIFSVMPDGVAKSNLALERFGKAGQELLPLLNLGPERLRALIKEGEKFGLVGERDARLADEWDKAQKNLHTSTSALSRELAAAFLPALTQIVQKLTGTVAGLRQFLAASTALQASLGVTITSLLTMAASLPLGKLYSLWASLFGGIKTLRDFNASLALIPDLVSQSKLLTLAGWVGMVTAAVLAGKSAWDSWKAAKERATAEQGLATSNVSSRAGQERAIAEAQAAGRLSAADADRMRGELAAAFSKTKTVTTGFGAKLEETGGKGFLSGLFNKQSQVPDLDAQYDALKKISMELRTILGLTEDTAAARELSAKDYERQMKMLDLQIAEARHYADKNEFEEKSLKSQMFDQGVINGLIEQRRQKSADFYNGEIKQLEKLRSLVSDENAIATINTQIADVKREQREQELKDKRDLLAVERDRKRIQDEMDKGSVLKQFSLARKSLLDEWGTLAQQIGRGFKSVIGTAVQSISDGITGLILRTKKWGDALREIGVNVLRELVNQAVQLGVKMVFSYALGEQAATSFSLLKIALGAKEMAITIAQNAAKLPGMIVGALATAIAEGGWGAVALIAAAVAALGAGVAWAAGAFADGGMVRGPGGPRDDMVPIMASDGEAVLNASAVARMGGERTINAINAGNVSGFARPAATGAGGSRQAHFHLHFDRAEMRRQMFSSPEYDHYWREAFARNREEYGV